MKNHQHGFTLIELAVSLIVIGLLLGGITIPISDTFQRAQNKSNDERLNAVRDALIGFAIANQRLPCPSESLTGTNAGLEPTECGANPDEASSGYSVTYKSRNTKGVLTGIVPWTILGVSKEDAFGNPIYYTVERRLTIKQYNDPVTTNNKTNSFIPLAINNGNLSTASGAYSISINGRDDANNNQKIDLAKNVAVVISSLGKKGSALDPSGNNSTYINTDANMIGDERTNATSCCSNLSDIQAKSSVEFYQRLYDDNKDTKDNSSNTIGAYDDQIVWIPWYQLIGIMTQAGRLQ